MNDWIIRLCVLLMNAGFEHLWAWLLCDSIWNLCLCFLLVRSLVLRREIRKHKHNSLEETGFTIAVTKYLALMMRKWLWQLWEMILELLLHLSVLWWSKTVVEQVPMEGQDMEERIGWNATRKSQPRWNSFFSLSRTVVLSDPTSAPCIIVVPSCVLQQREDLCEYSCKRGQGGMSENRRQCKR